MIVFPLTDYSYRKILNMTWPIILANASVPLLGLVDSAIIGRFGTIVELAALSVSVLIFNFILWGFGFLRMSTTGFVAQSLGQKAFSELTTIVIRSSILALALALILLLIHYIIFNLAIYLIRPPDTVVDDISRYYFIRIWGVPATFVLYVFMGTLIGLGKSHLILISQLTLNIFNGLFDYYFAVELKLGIEGIAIGTLLAEYITVVLVFILVYKSLPVKKYLSIFSKRQFIKLITANFDIMLRTLFLLISFAWFTRSSAQYGEVVLAANYLLLQLISFSAFFLDGYAHTSESIIGQAAGKKSMSDFNNGVKKSTVLAIITAILLACCIFFFGEDIIKLLTHHTPVIEKSISLLYFTTAYIALSVFAFQLDGIFIGATFGKALRNASLMSMIVFLLMSELLTQHLNVEGLWLAFIIYVVARACGLLLYYKPLQARITQ